MMGGAGGTTLAKSLFLNATSAGSGPPPSLVACPPKFVTRPGKGGEDLRGYLACLTRAHERSQ